MSGTSFISGLLGGFANSAAQGRKQAQDEANRKSDREDRILQMMASSDDPEIQQAAIAGLTDSTPRKKGFLDNLVGGKYESNPALAHITSLINAGKQIPAQAGPTVGGVNLPMGEPKLSPPPPPEPAPSGASAAMPATSAVQRPPAATQLASPSGLAGPPPNALPAARTQMAGAPAGTVPRQVFKSADEKIGASTSAKTSADLNAKRDALRSLGVPEERIRQTLIEDIGGAHSASIDIPRFMGNVQGKDLPDGSMDSAGRPVAPAQMYRHVLQTGKDRFEPITSVAASHHVYRSNAMVDGKPSLVEVLPDGSTKWIAWQGERDQNIPVTHEDGSQEIVRVPASFGGGGGTPPPTAVPASTPAPGAPNSSINTLPTKPPFAPAGAQAGPAKSSDVYPGVTPPPGPPPAATQPKSGNIQTRGAQYKVANIVTPDNPNPRAAREVGTTGTFVDAAGKVIEGAMRVPDSQVLVKPNADEQRTLDTITEARPMIARVKSLMGGKEGDNSLMSRGHGLLQRAEYATGFQPSDPVYRELIPLTSLLKVFITTPYMRGMRNMQYVAQIQDHLPSATDTPALIADKLKNIEASLAGIEKGAMTGLAGARQVSGGTTPPPKGGHYVGESVTLKDGTTATIKAVHPDGSFDLQ